MGLLRTARRLLGQTPKGHGDVVDVEVGDPAPAQGVRLEEIDEDRLAWIAVSAALSFQGWVKRRVETFEFIAASSVRRRMSVHFEVDDEVRRVVPHGTVYLPMTILSRTDLRNFDVRDEANAPVPVLTSEENGLLAERGLILLLRHYWPNGEALPSETIHDIVTGDADEARALAEAELRDEGLIGGPLARSLARASDEDKAEIKNLKALIRELAGGFLLLVPIEVDSRRLRVIKFSYDAGYRRSHTHTVGALPALFGHRIVSTFGWMARIEDFPEIEVGWGGSYHAEVIPPADVFTAELVLEVERRQPGEEGDETEPVFDRPKRDTHSYRPHVRTKAKSRSDVGRLSAHFHPQREGLIIPLLVASLVVSLTLTFLAKHRETIDVQALSALLIVPFALAAFYIRSSENSYVTRALRGLRLLALVPVVGGVSVLALVALGVLTKNHASDATLDWLETARLTAAWATAILVVAWLAPWMGGGRVRTELRKWEDRAESKRASFVVGLLGFSVRAVVLLGVAILVGAALTNPDGTVSLVKEIAGKIGC